MYYRNKDLIALFSSDGRVSTYDLRRMLYEMYLGRLSPKKINGKSIKKLDLLSPMILELNRNLNKARHRALELARDSHWYHLDEWPDERLQKRSKELGSFKAWVILMESIIPPKEGEPIMAWRSGSDSAVC
jgi:hypothetical protein